ESTERGGTATSHSDEPSGGGQTRGGDNVQSMTITTESLDIPPGHVGIVERHNRQMATVLQMLNDVKGTDAVPFVRRKGEAMDEIQNMFFRVIPHFFTPHPGKSPFAIRCDDSYRKCSVSMREPSRPSLLSASRHEIARADGVSVTLAG